MKQVIALLIALCLAVPADAARLRHERQDYLDANLRAIFYHDRQLNDRFLGVVT